MGVYINSYREQRITLHPVDRSMPLYMTVNWGLHVANRFRSTYGYRLEDELTALFLGHSEHFCRVRHDYYQLMSDLYEKAFFARSMCFSSTRMNVKRRFAGTVHVQALWMPMTGP